MCLDGGSTSFRFLHFVCCRPARLLRSGEVGQHSGEVVHGSGPSGPPQGMWSAVSIGSETVALEPLALELVDL